MAGRAERITLLVACEATLIWTGLTLLGWSSGAIGGLGGGLVGGLIGASFANIGIDRMARSREMAARAAIRDYRDPGPDLREVADAQARVMLAAPAVERWLPGLVLGGLAVACVVVALVRDDATDALPAVPLLILAGLVVLLRRRTDAAASRWLAEPRVPSDRSA